MSWLGESIWRDKLLLSEVLANGAYGVTHVKISPAGLKLFRYSQLYPIIALIVAGLSPARRRDRMVGARLRLESRSP